GHGVAAARRRQRRGLCPVAWPVDPRSRHAEGGRRGLTGACGALLGDLPLAGAADRATESRPISTQLLRSFSPRHLFELGEAINNDRGAPNGNRLRHRRKSNEARGRDPLLLHQRVRNPSPPGSPNIPENSTIYEGRANPTLKGAGLCARPMPRLCRGNAPAAFRGAMRGILRVNSNAPVQCATIRRLSGSLDARG